MLLFVAHPRGFAPHVGVLPPSGHILIVAATKNATINDTKEQLLFLCIEEKKRKKIQKFVTLQPLRFGTALITRYEYILN